MDKSQYKFEKSFHGSKKIIKIIFPFNNDLKNKLKQEISSARWSTTLKCWYVPNNEFFRKKLELPNDEIADYKKYFKLCGENQVAFARMYEQLKLKGYSKNTVKTYLSEFSQLLKILGNFPVDNLTPERIRSYILFCIEKQKLSENLIHSRLNAIKFYFEKVLHRQRFMMEIPRPKKHKQLPKVISVQHLKKMFESTHYSKHRLMLKLCYGMGLRVSEIINLKIGHIDSNRMQVHIEAAKGKKDRYVQLPESILPELRDYYKEHLPKNYLFEGQNGGQYSTRSAQAVFKQALERAGVKKKVGIHSLRHSYATHLLEMGTDISYIQKLLGHNDIKTTSIYAHVKKSDVIKIKSPLDNL
jgi:integrase/recombinase XerD